MLFASPLLCFQFCNHRTRHLSFGTKLNWVTYNEHQSIIDHQPDSSRWAPFQEVNGIIGQGRRDSALADRGQAELPTWRGPRSNADTQTHSWSSRSKAHTCSHSHSLLQHPGHSLLWSSCTEAMPPPAPKWKLPPKTAPQRWSCYGAPQEEDIGCSSKW